MSFNSVSICLISFLHSEGKTLAEHEEGDKGNNHNGVTGEVAELAAGVEEEVAGEGEEDVEAEEEGDEEEGIRDHRKQRQN